MGEVITIGIDIAKLVFQIHGVDADGTVVIRRRVGRARVLEFFADLPPCLVGMEACATAHHWARELKKFGHDARLMPPTYVKAYVKRGKVGLHSATYFINVTRFLTSDANDRVVYWGRVEARQPRYGYLVCDHSPSASVFRDVFRLTATDRGWRAGPDPTISITGARAANRCHQRARASNWDRWSASARPTKRVACDFSCWLRIAALTSDSLFSPCSSLVPLVYMGLPFAILLGARSLAPPALTDDEVCARTPLSRRFPMPSGCR